MYRGGTRAVRAREDASHPPSAMLSATRIAPTATIPSPESQGRYSATRPKAYPATNSSVMAMALDTRIA
jgi:hypothetical protein